jgi:hypothetical protein
MTALGRIPITGRELVGTVYQAVRGAPGRVEYPATFTKAE